MLVADCFTFLNAHSYRHMSLEMGKHAKAVIPHGPNDA